MTMLMVKVNEASLPGAAGRLGNIKPKIFIPPLSLFTPSEYNPLILLSCPAHSISRCTDLSQPLQTTLKGKKCHLTLDRWEKYNSKIPFPPLLGVMLIVIV